MILSGNITARIKRFAASVGSGYDYHGNSTVLIVAILNGNITASSIGFFG
jgi:hypothetical protein